MRTAVWQRGRVAETRRLASIPCHAATLPLCLLFIVACGGGGKAATASKPTIHDSAGVTIVGNGKSAWTESDAWTLADSPSVDIGTAQGDTNYQLFRVAAALRLDDGRIVVASYGTHDLRFYGANGTFQSRTGRDGEGPGEFRGLAGVWRYRGDSLVTWDDRLRRMSVFSADGAFGRIATPAKSGMNPRMIGVISGDTTFIVDHIYADIESRLTQQYETFLEHGPDGHRIDSLGPFPSQQMMRISAGGNGFVVGGTIFGPVTVVTTTPNGFVVGLARDFSFDMYDATGRLRREVRWPGQHERVTSQDVARFKVERLAGITDPNTRRDVRAIYEHSPYADEFAPYAEAVSDRDGDVWLRRFHRPGDDAPNRWLVFDPDGVWLGGVDIPTDLRILEIGRDYVLALKSDENDVQHVVEYALWKPDVRPEEGA